MAVEIQSHLPKLTTAERQQFQSLRRAVLDSQIGPTLAATVSWLGSGELTIPESPTTLDQACEVAPILHQLGTKLAAAVTSAESDPSFGAYHLRLYETPFGIFQPAAPNFHWARQSSFNRAATELFSAIQGNIPLRADYSWDNITAIYQVMGKRLPALPEELIFVGGPDDGFINDRVSVTLPTKAPFMFVDYTYRLRGRLRGQKGPGNPVRPQSPPESVTIQVITLDQHYPYLSQRANLSGNLYLQHSPRF